MNYQEFPIIRFFNEINSEHDAVKLVWKYKIQENGYYCPKCRRKKYYQHNERPEIRECRHCGHQNRLRVGTIFENSKMPMLTWVRAIYLMMMGKRGISALELQRQLKIGCYQTALLMLRRIRTALSERDSRYKLEGIIEMDGAHFGKRATGNQESIMIAVETKKWIDDRGEEKSKAGFAKVLFEKEDSESAQKLVTQSIRECSEVHTDGAKAYLNDLEGVSLKSMPMYGDPSRLDEWLPWVHKFISNAKIWILGTHHGVNTKHLNLYLAEYTYRFNRRHDHKSYFSRALLACSSSLVTSPPDVALAA